MTARSRTRERVTRAVVAAAARGELELACAELFMFVQALQRGDRDGIRI